MTQGHDVKTIIEQPPGNRGTSFRLAALLLVITVSIVASKLGEEHFVKSLKNDCNSLFSDRLMPATTLFHLSDALHQRKDTLTRFLPTEENAETVHYRLGEYDASIEHHIGTIEKTYLVDDETRLLKELRASLKSYARVESELLAHHKSGKRTFDEQKLQLAFDELRAELLNLMNVQQTVGQKLKSESLSSATNVTTLLYLQLGIAFVLGLIASALALSLRPRNFSARTPSQRARMH